MSGQAFCYVFYLKRLSNSNVLGEAGGTPAGETRPGACSLAIHLYLLRRIIPGQIMLAYCPTAP